MLSKQHNKNIKSTKKIMGQAMGKNWLKSNLTSLGLITLLVTPTFASSLIISPIEQESVEDTGVGANNATVAVENTMPPSDEEMPMAQAKNAFEAATAKLSQHLPDDTDQESAAKGKALHLIALNEFLLDFTGAPTDLTYEAFMEEAEAAIKLANTSVRLVKNVFQYFSNDTNVPQQGKSNEEVYAEEREVMPLIFSSIIGNIFYTLHERFEAVKANIEEGSQESYDVLKTQLDIFTPFISAPFDDRHLTEALSRQDKTQHDSIFSDAHAATVNLMSRKAQTLLMEIALHPLAKVDGFSDLTPAPEDDELIKRAIDKITALDLLFEYYKVSSKLHDAAIAHHRREIAQKTAELNPVIGEMEALQRALQAAESYAETAELSKQLQAIQQRSIFTELREKQIALENMLYSHETFAQQQGTFKKRRNDFVGVLYSLVNDLNNDLSDTIRAQGVAKIKALAKAQVAALNEQAEATLIESIIQARIAQAVFKARADEQEHQAQGPHEDSERTNATNSGTFADTSDGDNDAVFPTDEDATVSES